MANKCQFNSIGIKCPRDDFKNGKCIFHLENKNEEEIKKFNDELINELKLELDTTEMDDFSGFIFPRDIYLYYRFKNNVSFEDAIFEGDVHFRNPKFFHRSAIFDKEAAFIGIKCKGNMDFSYVVFKQLAIFQNFEFGKDAIFTESNFEKVRFQGIKFNGNVLFDKSKCNIADFIGSEFCSDNGTEANFSFTVLKLEILKIWPNS